MAQFGLAYDITCANEGGYSNDPVDNGGETWRGIARNKNPNWGGWPVIDDLKRATGFPSTLKTAAQLDVDARAFYKSRYWDALLLDNVNNQDVADKLFDIAVNCGVGFAGKALQRGLDVANQNGAYYADLSVDGKVGNKTITALNCHPRPDVIFKCLNTIQGEHYIDLAEHDGKQEAFINGWFANRISGIVDEYGK